MSTEPETSSSSKSAVSQRQVEAKVSKKSHKDKDGAAAATNNQEATKKSLKLDLKGKETDLESLKSPKSPIGGKHLRSFGPPQTKPKKTMERDLRA